MAAATTLTTNPLLFKKLSYKPADLTAIVLVGTVPFTLVAHPSVPAHDSQGVRHLREGQARTPDVFDRRPARVLTPP
jgi:tripartite-type tricarboxylate transporter receptor subunit TctC